VSDVPVDILRRLLRLDASTGRLFWLERTPDLFPGCKSPEPYCQSWNARYAGREAFTALNKGYRVGRIYDRMAQAGRVVFALANGRWPENNIDHIDGNPLNNRPENLRDIPQAGNTKNMRLPRHNTSGIVGVGFIRTSGRWFAQIGSRKNHVFLGCYATKEEAAAARRAAERELGYHANHGRRA
jgi:hypothetical protein